mmetsp:Transcript_48924/g.153681  ORF Transcript_48924/g.153681 Transcript_48924/m.153681 type:complete len:312 (-) Transcript_48924:314-1249(-)
MPLPRTCSLLPCTHHTARPLSSRRVWLDPRPQPDSVDRHLVQHALLLRERRLQRLFCMRELGDEEHETATSRTRERRPVYQVAHLGQHAADSLRFRIAHHLLLRPVPVEARPHLRNIAGQQRGLHCSRVCHQLSHVSEDGGVGGEPTAEHVLQQVACEARLPRIHQREVGVEQVDRFGGEGQDDRVNAQRQPWWRGAALDARQQPACLVLPAATCGEHLLYLQHRVGERLGGVHPPHRPADAADEHPRQYRGRAQPRAGRQPRPRYELDTTASSLQLGGEGGAVGRVEGDEAAEEQHRLRQSARGERRVVV